MRTRVGWVSLFARDGMVMPSLSALESATGLHVWQTKNSVDNAGRWVRFSNCNL
jgi:hypothetical protein